MIEQFTGQYRFLSNFHLVDIDYEGILYPSSEHAYQAAKSPIQQVKLSIAGNPDPRNAKRMGRNIQMRPDWNQVRLAVMEEILRIKFANPIMRRLLLATEGQEIVEGNWWGDTYWGVCKGVGQNNLGKLHMKIRADLIRESKLPHPAHDNHHSNLRFERPVFGQRQLR